MLSPETDALLVQLAAPPFEARGVTPIWQQIANRLKIACEGNQLAGNDRLPSENRMAEIFGVTRVTMRRALARLQEEGLLQARKGVGIFVRSHPLRYRLDHGSRFSDGLDLPGTQVAALTLSITRGRATAAEAEALDLAPEAPVIRLRRLRLVENVPVYLANKTFPAALFPDFETALAARESVRDVYLAHGIANYRRAETRVSGGFATEDEALALRLSRHMPVLRTVAINVTFDGRPIEYNLGTWPLTAVELVLTDPQH